MFKNIIIGGIKIIFLLVIILIQIKCGKKDEECQFGLGKYEEEYCSVSKNCRGK